MPAFIGENYFCATGNRGPGFDEVLYNYDPLWDGEGCGSSNTCCDLNSPLWFCTQLTSEVRICLDTGLVDIFIMEDD